MRAASGAEAAIAALVFYICDMSQPASAPEPLPDGSIESAGPIDVVTAAPIVVQKKIEAPIFAPPQPEGHIARIEEKIRQWLRKHTIRRKIALVPILVSGAALVIAGIVLFACEFVSQYLSARDSLAVLARVTAESAQAPLQLNVAPPVITTLNALASQPDITGAAIFFADGRLFARSQRISESIPARLEAPRKGSAPGLSFLQHYEPVFAGPRLIGTVVVESSLRPVFNQLWNKAIITLFALGLAALAARWLAKRLEPVVSEPISALANIMDATVKDGDYRQRATKESKDAVGLLAESFNHLLEEIQKRDSTIHQAQIDLEMNVLARTSVLHQQVQDRKHSEGALRDSEMRYRNLFENNPMPMFVVNLETLDFVAVNNAAMRHYGYEQAEFIHLSLPAITHATDPLVVTRTFRSGAKSLDAGEWKHQKKNGEIIEVQLTAHAIVFAGKVAKIVLANDVTERNRAQRQLEELHKKLVETSRQAGMAEVATGVLHNVGNVLNSVNVTATLLAENARQTKTASVRRIAELLDANKGDLPRFFSNSGKGALLPGYLASLAQQLDTEQATRLSEAEQLKKNVAHIKDIVAMQQSYAKVSSVLEQHTPESLVKEALRMAETELQRDHVTVRSECPDTLPEVHTDRHKVLQILINLINNARQAMSETHQPERLLTITAAKIGDNFVRIAVQDHGCGIAPENLTRIFNHGFTTKNNGHGFGLHASANAAKEVGGNLSASSDGLGLGAVFTLDLPAKTATKEPTK